ncbi:MAG: enoyl-CoA hydratase/isomerase family protein [Myxococcales bacterium]|nr:enoyl-CoA hydratase/isomerase family protein [Myxococcales bacterium]
MAKPIDEVAVLGAGVMGAAIAAHLANAGFKVLLLDIAPRDAPPGDAWARNRIARDGLARAKASKPASFFSKRFEPLVTVGNLDDDLGRAAACDFIVEAVIENLAIKRSLYEKLDALGGGAVIASNTSGLPLAELVAGRSHAFKQRFLITHFFNPPRYLKLVEVVTGEETSDAAVALAEQVCGTYLGKGLVRAKDTPNFIANRVGTFSLMRTLALAVEQRYTVEEVDAIFGKPLGRPKSAVFRTADVVGLDTLVHVANNCHEALTNDERREVFALPDVLKELVERKWLGSKTKQGFYKKEGAGIVQLNLATLAYEPLTKPRFASIGATKGVDDLDERIRRVVNGDDRASSLARQVLYETLIYAANRMGDIADSVVDVDRALKWGFGWERGPFETWDALGVPETISKMEAAGLAVPAWVKERVAAGETHFYERETPTELRQLAVRGGYHPVPQDERRLSLEEVRAFGGEVERNAGASLLDLGDGVFCVEFHAKMNAIDADIVSMMQKGVERAERDGVALIIGNEAPDAFCAGANLFSLMVGLSQNNYAAVDQILIGFQNACMRTRYARVPVVCAPFGLALGGGAEVVLGCPHVRAAAELYVGCVEVGVGLIPAGGGCMEMAARASALADTNPNVDLLALVRQPFEYLGTARVSTSAEEGRDLGYLHAHDSVSMSRDTLLADAKQLALGLARAGYRPPPPRRVKVVGTTGAATMKAALHNLADAHRISEHDAKIGSHLARILSGGDVAPGARVTEQHLLDLEREAFLSLCGEEKSRARIQHMLTTSKPLRN